MSNLRIMHRNLFDTYSALAMAVGASNASFPLTNLSDDSKTKTWRSTDLLSPKIRVTWASGQTIMGVALAYTNLIQGSTVTINLFNAATGGTLVYNSGAISVDYDYDAPIGFSSIGSASFAYGGGAHVSAFFGTITGVRRMEIEFTSDGNPDNYIEVSRIIAGRYITTDRDVSENTSIGFIDSTTGLRTASGNYITDRGTITRAMDFPLNAFSASDKALLNNLFRSVGKSQPIFVSLIPTATVGEEQLSAQMYGKFDQDMIINYPFYQRYSTSLRIIEL